MLRRTTTGGIMVMALMSCSLVAMAAPLPAIEVKSDAELYASSGKILTQEEQERAAIENMIRARDGGGEASGSINLDAIALSDVRSGTEIKPGNKINVRVVHVAANVSSNLDTVRVKVTTSSGDSIPAFPLKETGPYAGSFEGAIPTVSAPATAFASDSEDGKDPNQTISAGNYPGWAGLADNVRPKTFTVDLNTSVALGQMTILSDVPGRKLKKFVVQTSMNGKRFANLGAWPEPLHASDGSAQMELVRIADSAGHLLAGKQARTAIDGELLEIQNYLEIGHMIKGVPKAVVKSSFSLSMDPNLNGQANPIGLAGDGPNSWYILHVSGSFFVPKRQVRTFRLAPKEAADPLAVRFYFTIDGKLPVPSKNPLVAKDPFEISGPLAKGVHRMDVYVSAQRKASPAFEVLQDIPEDPYMAPCPPEMFDPVKHPELTASKFRPAEVTADAAASTFTIAFPPGANARMVRLWLLDFETDAPAIKRLTLTNAGGKKVLPTDQDLILARKNQTLEIVPGDKISVVYENPRYIAKDKQVLEASLSATYFNAAISACFVESTTDKQGNRKPIFIPMRRFRPNDTINVFISDPDEDVSDEPDKVKFTAATSVSKPTVVDAIETDKHTGVFLGKVFPVEGEKQRPSDLPVTEGDDVLLTYMDKDNTDPGIPWERTCLVEQVMQTTPELRVYDVVSHLLPTNQIGMAKSDPKAQKDDEFVPPMRGLTLTRPETNRESPAVGLMGVPIVVEVTYPTIALSPASKTTVYAQTSAGRKKAKKEARPEVAPAPTPGPAAAVPGGTAPAAGGEAAPAAGGEAAPAAGGEAAPAAGGEAAPAAGDEAAPASGTQTAKEAFDVSVPGTITLNAGPSRAGTVSAPAGYSKTVTVRGDMYATGDALDDGVFTFSVPLRLGGVPDQTWLEAATTNREEEAAKGQLAVLGGDTVYVGYAYADTNGVTNWLTQTIDLTSDGFFHVMDSKYQAQMDRIHVGESFYMRVIDPFMDKTDGKDFVDVKLTTRGSTNTVVARLMETYAHTGVFKGRRQLVFGGDTNKLAEAEVLGVQYGDTITANYKGDSENSMKIDQTLLVYKGADGEILAFSKRFKDQDIAVQTQLTIAEAYFEMAKKHREIQQDSLARREIAQGKKLLDEAIRDFPNAQARAQADYLLAELSLEFANDAVNEDAKRKFYQEAVSRFSDIVATYPDNAQAPRAQYKKALTLEKMGEIDQACEEYVKLSYRYPDNELVAETIARLGSYFLTKGNGFLEKAKAATDVVEKEKLKMQAKDMNRTAAQVFSRLAPRFPDHKLAGKTQVLSGQCYMRAEEYERAIMMFLKVVDAKKADAALIAEAMYWCGDCYMKTKEIRDAYRMFKKITWDYPETTWAKYARGRLTEPALAKADEEKEK